MKKYIFIKRFISAFVLSMFCLTPNVYATGQIVTVGGYNNSAYNNGYTYDEYVNGAEKLQNNVIPGNVVKFGRGQKLPVFIQDQVSTKDALAGNNVIAVLAQDWVMNGMLIADAGSVIYGTVSNTVSAGGWSRNGKLQIDFNRMETPEGQIYDLVTEKIDIEVEGSKSVVAKNIAKGVGIVLVGALIGAAIAFSGSSVSYRSRDNRGRNTAIGAGVGAAIFTGSALIGAANQKGDDITIPANTNFEIVLLDDIVISK